MHHKDESRTNQKPGNEQDELANCPSFTWPHPQVSTAAEAPVIPRCYIGEMDRRAVGAEAHQTLSAQRSKVARKDILQLKGVGDLERQEGLTKVELACNTSEKAQSVDYMVTATIFTSLTLQLCPDVSARVCPGREGRHGLQLWRSGILISKEKVDLIEDDGRFW